jgi:hypothetical protein
MLLKHIRYAFDISCFVVPFFDQNKIKESWAYSMKFDPELHAFLQAAKKLQNKRLFKEISTEALQNVNYEIAADPEIKKDLEKFLK